MASGDFAGKGSEGIRCWVSALRVGILLLTLLGRHLCIAEIAPFEAGSSRTGVVRVWEVFVMYVSP